MWILLGDYSISWIFRGVFRVFFRVFLPLYDVFPHPLFYGFHTPFFVDVAPPFFVDVAHPFLVNFHPLFVSGFAGAGEKTVPRAGLEPATPGATIRCSTN